MKIRINEVWNKEGKSEELTVINVDSKDFRYAVHLVQDWVRENRPDLELATGIDAHGYHAEAIN